MYGVIYKITNKFNCKDYIGQTVQTLKERFKQHTKADSVIGHAIRKYGRKNFTIEVIEECETREQLNEREIFWIAFFNCKVPNGYNYTDGGQGATEQFGEKNFGLRFSTAERRTATTAPTAATAVGLTRMKHCSDFRNHTATKRRTKI